MSQPFRLDIRAVKQGHSIVCYYSYGQDTKSGKTLKTTIGRACSEPIRIQALLYAWKIGLREHFPTSQQALRKKRDEEKKSNELSSSRI